MFTWAHMSFNGDLIIDWEEVRMNSNMFDRGHRNHDAEMGKLLSIVQRECYERGFKDGIRSQDSERMWSSHVQGEA